MSCAHGYVDGNKMFEVLLKDGKVTLKDPTEKIYIEKK